MKTHAEAKKSTPSRTLATPVPNALAHQAQLRSALLRAGVQPRLEIGAINDPLEREADVAAERVMRMPESSLPSPACGRGAGGEGTLVQTKASATTTQASPQLESTLNSLNSGGTALDAPTRAFFEPRFGQDFSQVRLHTDANAAQMAESLSAKAFTLGNNIAFGANQYSGNTPTGRSLLGHELAHVVQQRGLGDGGAAVQGNLIQCQDANEGTDEDRWAYGEIRSHALHPEGLADAKASIAAVCRRNSARRNCSSQSGANSQGPDRTAWSNIRRANNGNDLSNGGNYFCVGDQRCRIVSHCRPTYQHGEPVPPEQARTTPLEPTGQVTVNGLTIYFYYDSRLGNCPLPEGEVREQSGTDRD